MAQPITTTLDPEQQRIAGDALSAAVADLIDLTLISKQAHWNVVGDRFRSLHLALDEVVDDARRYTDAAAERATAIGVSPDGRAATVAGSSGAQGFPGGWQRDVDVIEAMIGNLAAIVRRMRQHIEATEKADPVTQDLFIGITARLEQLHWMWEAQRHR